jgi:hypothetical protein
LFECRNSSLTLRNKLQIFEKKYPGKYVDLREIIVEWEILYKAGLRDGAGHLLDSPIQGSYNDPDMQLGSRKKKSRQNFSSSTRFQKEGEKFSGSLGEHQLDGIN